MLITILCCATEDESHRHLIHIIHMHDAHQQLPDENKVILLWNFLLQKQEAFEKCWAHSALRAAARPFTRCRYRYCRTPPAHRCPRRQRRQRQRVTEGTAMAPWNGPNYSIWPNLTYAYHTELCSYVRGRP